MSVSMKARNLKAVTTQPCAYGCCTKIFDTKMKTVARRNIRRTSKQEVRNGHFE